MVMHKMFMQLLFSEMQFYVILDIYVLDPTNTAPS